MKIKHLLNGVAIVAGFAIAAPAWAQGPAPTGRSHGGFSGDASNPGSGPMATTAPSTPDTTSATPPKHRHARHVTHAAAHHKMAPLTGSTANQLNQQELARLQTGSSMPPSAAPMPGPQMQGGNSMGMPGPSPGGPGLTPYSTGTPRSGQHGTVQ